MKQLLIETVVNGFIVNENDRMLPPGQVQRDKTHVFNNAKDLAEFVNKWGEDHDKTSS